MEEITSAELFKVIGKNVKYYRKLYNLKVGKMTQEDLAEIVDVSTALIGGLESDKINQGISVFNLWKRDYRKSCVNRISFRLIT